MSEVRKGRRTGPKHHSEGTKRLISESAKGNKRRVGKIHSAEARKKIGAKSKGRVFSIESRQKISEALKGNQHTKGKPWSIARRDAYEREERKGYSGFNNAREKTSSRSKAARES